MMLFVNFYKTMILVIDWNTKSGLKTSHRRTMMELVAKNSSYFRISDP